MLRVFKQYKRLLFSVNMALYRRS